MSEVYGKAWKFGDHVDTDQIIPADRLISVNNDHLGDFLFERARPGFPKQVSKGDVIVAGKNFGCGSSREHAPRSIMQAGITCVVAESFARIFYRNSINIGLILVECKIDADEGDVIYCRHGRRSGKEHDVRKELELPSIPAVHQGAHKIRRADGPYT